MIAVIHRRQSAVAQSTSLFQGGHMRSRTIVGALLLFGLVAGGVQTSSVAHATATKKWAIVNISEPVLVNGQFLMGKYVFVHDDEKMANGGDCTSIYEFDPVRGLGAERVSFMCIPREHRTSAGQTVLSFVRDSNFAVNRLTEYQ